MATSLLYVAWHTGTQFRLEPDVGLAIVKLFGVGLMYQAVFSLTHKLLVIWPLFNAAGVLIDFTVNLDAIGMVVQRLPWALGAVGAMVITAIMVEIRASR